MALSLVAPAVIFMGLLAQSEYENSRRRYEEQLLATTRALSLATDRQIAQGQFVLQALAVSPSLQAGDFPAFEDQAREVLIGRPGWISLREGDRFILHSYYPAGAYPTPSPIPEDTQQALRSGQTVISNLRKGAVSNRPTIVIETPVVVGGKLYVLAYGQNPLAFASLFRAQNLPAAWTGSIVDRNASLVARSKDHARFVGRQASQEMREAMAKRPEGVILTHTLDGTPSLSAFSRSPTYGWTFIVGVPRSELRAGAVRAVTYIALATGVLMALGLSLALLLGRRISREVRSLMEDAQTITRGGEIAPRPRDLLETSEVRRALRHVSSELRQREAERAGAAARQQVMINELNHRVKNTLATVQSLARQSLGKADPEGRREAFIERLVALSHAHDLLTRRVWENAELSEVVAQTLEPYEGRALISGPSVSLSPNAAVTLSMVFHELATNAAKYGALSSPAGLVNVDWRLDAATSNLVLTWSEQGGPPVVAPKHAGFGSRLITTSIKTEFAGKAAVDYGPDGVRCVLRLPLSDRIGMARPVTAQTG